MKVKLWLGITILTGGSFVLGAVLGLLVLRSQFKSTINGEDTLLRSFIHYQTSSTLDLNQKETKELDALFTQSITRLRLHHLHYEAAVGEEIFSSLQLFLNRKDAASRRHITELLRNRYAKVRQPVKGPLFLSIGASFQQIQEIEKILAQSELGSIDISKGVKGTQLSLVYKHKDSISDLLDEPQKVLFHSWLTLQMNNL